MEIKPGMLVRSKAGRDKGHVYAVIDVDNKYVYAADGAERPAAAFTGQEGQPVQPAAERLRQVLTPLRKNIRRRPEATFVHRKRRNCA